MRLKLMSVLLLLTVCLLRAEPPAAADALAELQGRWRVTSFVFDGDALPVGEDTWFKIEGDKIVFEETPNDIGTITLDTSKSPAWLDITDQANAVNAGIYKIEGNVLTICSAFPNHDRPTTFESIKGTKDFLTTQEHEQVEKP